MPRRKVKPVGEKRTSKTTEKKVKVIGQEQYIKAGTGEVEEFQVINIEDRDFNFHKLWLGHIINSLDLIGNQKTKLAFWIIEQLDYENKLCMTYRQIAEKSGISLDTVSRTMKALQECNFIQPINQGCYRVNPDVVFKGSRNNRLNVLYQYQETNISSSSKEEETTDTSVYTDVYEADEGEKQELDGQTTMFGIGVEMSAKAHTD